MAFDINRFMAGQANALGDVTSQLGRQGEDFQTLPALFRDKISVHNCRIKTARKSLIGDALIWGHSTFGIWGTGSWADSASISSFTFGSSEYGVLDVNYWGDRTSAWELYTVHNDLNLFIEQFDNNRFIDTLVSTGSFAIGSYYSIPDGEMLITDYIAKEDKVYKTIYINNLEAEYNDGSDASSGLAISAIINGIEYPLSIGANNISNISTDGIVLKFTNTNEGIQFGETGLTFPITFFSLESIKLKYFECKYST